MHGVNGLRYDSSCKTVFSEMTDMSCWERLEKCSEHCVLTAVAKGDGGPRGSRIEMVIDYSKCMISV